jgi:hypothetical protein
MIPSFSKLRMMIAKKALKPCDYFMQTPFTAEIKA